MFSMRFGEEVIRRSRILFEVGLVACEISCERELFKRKSRVSGVKCVTVDLAVDTVSFFVHVVEQLRQIYVEAID